MTAPHAPWRVGTHYGIHVYEGDRPVATFHREEDARRCVADREAVQRMRELLDRPDRLDSHIEHQFRRALDGAT